VSVLFTLVAGAAFACAQPRAIDGDTFACGTAAPGIRGPEETRKVRLEAVNARELHGNRCSASAPCPPASAAQGKATLQALLNREPVTCTPTGQDRYGRTVARCRTPHAGDVSCALVRAGAAAEWRKYGRACR